MVFLGDRVKHMNDTMRCKADFEDDLKVYVELIGLVDRYGNIMPVSFKWEDGERYEIEAVTEVRPTVQLKTGGSGFRYAIKVHNKQSYLYLEENEGVCKWYMVPKKRVAK